MSGGPVGRPPDERRCTATNRPHTGKPERCTKWARPGQDTCNSHAPDRPVVGAPPYERRCTATVKNGPRAGRQCPNWAMKGQKVCRRHGGGSPQAARAASRRIQEAELTESANRLLVQLGADPVENPLTALAELAGEVLATKRAFANRVNELAEIRYTDDKGGEQLRSEVALYERAVGQAANLLTAIAKLNIDERLARITEQQAEKVMAAIDAALANAGVTGPAAVNAKRAAARHLRSVS
ncbi:hypothetical protein [Streptomyces sp. NPDC019937]|uniref:hypothetical protein n=1 Tax=Streptomyces sp. NPDC019937 TaxID=3154787 RepID=UPI0033D764F2